MTCSHALILLCLRSQNCSRLTFTLQFPPCFPSLPQSLPNPQKHYEHKQYKKGIKLADQILKKFSEHGGELYHPDEPEDAVEE